MKKKTIIIIILIIVLVTVSAGTIAAKGKLNIKKALDAFRSKEEIHFLDEEEFLEQIDERDAGEVLFASSIATAFNKTVDDIYELIDKYDHDIDKVHEVLRIERGDGRKEPLYLPDKPTPEEAEEITRNIVLGNVMTDPGGRGNFINNQKMRLVTLKEARKTFAEASFLYAFDEMEFEKLLELRRPGEVLLAGNLAHNFEMSVDYVLGIFDDFDSDYHAAYDVLYDEWWGRQ